MDNTDILIAGGGLAGVSLALLLCHHTDFSVTLVEAVELPPPGDTPFTPSFDARGTALTQGSLLTYQQLGLFDAIMENAAPIDLVDVSTRGYLGRTQMQAAEEGVAQLGAVIENRRLGRILLQALYAQPRIQLVMPNKVAQATRLESGYHVTLDDGQEAQCRLLVVADGARSHTRELLGISAHHDHTGEAALTANIAIDKPHQGRAFERFIKSGPLAFLPLPDERMAMVWTGRNSVIDELAALPEAELLARVQEESQLLDISVTRIGKKVAYPLILTQTAAQAIPYAVVVGNAAHTLHPVAAQGFNLTLRDLANLAETLAGAAHPGKLSVLQQYVDKRQVDQAVIKRFSHLLPDLFRVQFGPFAHARQLGLVGLSVLPGLRHKLARRAMGL